MRRVLSTERTIVGGFSLALAVLFIVAGVSVWLTVTLLRDLNAISQQNNILSVIAEANTRLPQLATSARLFRATRDETSFLDLQREEREFNEKLKQIDLMTNDSRTQRDRMSLLIKLLDDKVKATTRETNDATLEKTWGITAGVSNMRPMADLLMAISAEERQELGSWNDAAKQEAKLALWTIGTASLLTVVLVGAAPFVILRDLKARRRAAEELERARQAAESASVAKTAFLANMSHELRTPLTSIMGYADLMLDPEASNSRRIEYLQTLRRSGEHLVTLINDILDVSKIEAGRMTIEYVECRTVDMLADVDSLMRSRAREKGLDFFVEYQTAIPERINTDPTRFRQILMNLVGNAVKFTDEGCVKVIIRFESRPEPASMTSTASAGSLSHLMTVSVVDTGVGISESQQKQLFQPFMQADLSTTRRFGGTGLGLSISRRLARMLGGDLTVQSEVAKGSSFTLAIPMELQSGMNMLPPGEASQRVAGVGRDLEVRAHDLGVRILLAEDGPENREVIMLHLRRAGCDIVSAEDGDQASELALNALATGSPFDVILMDMQMPVMDGYTATSKLRSQGYTGVIIALTAHALKEDRDRCMRVGCDEYASKPVDMRSLIQMIARFCGRAAGFTVVEKLAQDPVLRNLTRKFCEGTGEAISALRDCAAQGAWEKLAGSAHKLAGAGGAYGFESITREAKTLEKLCHEKAPTEQINHQIGLLEGVCRQARSDLDQAENASTVVAAS